MPYDAPYSGGFSPGARLFAVNGDFTKCDPCSPPQVTYPFKGDSFPGQRDIILLNSSGVYQRVGLGSGYNLQPFAANQASIVIEQDFMVAMAYYNPLPLNFPYYYPWSVGWSGRCQDLTNAFLVEETPPQDMGGGIGKVRRKFASLPTTRNEMESYAYSFPAVSDNSTPPLVRDGRTAIVFSRVQYDYFVYDNLNILSWIPLFPSGPRLNATTGINPTGLILDRQRYFINAAGMVINKELNGTETLTDDPTGSPPAPTVPSFSQWADWAGRLSNPKAEIVAEESSFGPGPWLGNIYQRKTRFVLAQ